MVPDDISGYIEKLRTRAAELEKELADPDIYAKTEVFRKVNQEHSKLNTLLDKFDLWVKSLNDLAENRVMLGEEQDNELRELIESDISQLENSCSSLEEDIQISLLPPDPNDSKNIIIEIQPAAGGD